MANKTIPEFTPLLTSATVADDDVLLIYDRSAASPRTRGIEKSELLDAVTVATATVTSEGIVELATPSEAVTGTDNVRAVTPLALASVVADRVVGPASVTDDVLAAFDGVTGKLVKATAIDKDAVVTMTGTQALTNKTLTSPVLTTPALGTPSALVLTNATGTPASLGLANATGLPIAGGGTGQATAAAAFNALSPTTTAGDISYHDGTNDVRLAKGTAYQSLRMNRSALAPEWSNDTGRTIYLSTTGSDGDLGGLAGPVLTAAKAIELAGSNGEIVMRGGDYNNPANRIIFDITNTARIKIRAFSSERVRVFLGEHKANGGAVFTNHSGTVWKVAITTIIPNATAIPNNIPWVFEYETPEGAITTATAHPLQKQRSTSGGSGYRMEHKRLTRAANLATLEAGGAGTFWYQLDTGVPTVYFRRSDSADPNAIGGGIWIPSQTAGRSFIIGGTGAQHVEVEGIEVYFGKYGFDLDSVASYRLSSCMAYGSGDLGVYTDAVLFGEEWNCEYAANAADGSNLHAQGLDLDLIHSPKFFFFNPWAHDNGDQGISGHEGCEIFIWGGLLESNGNGGLLGFGLVSCHGVHARNNTTCGFSVLASGSLGAIQDVMECVDCTSEGDANGYFPSAQGQGAGTAKIIVRGGRVTGATTAAFNAQADSIIEWFGVFLSGNAANTAGAGTLTNNNPVLATGSTADQIITALQTLGLFKQS